MSEIEMTQADREAARKFIADEWPSWDHDHQTVSAELMVAFARHRHEARAEALEEAAKVADEQVARAINSALPGWTVTHARRDEAQRIAKAIRALQIEEPE